MSDTKKKNNGRGKSGRKKNKDINNLSIDATRKRPKTDSGKSLVEYDPLQRYLSEVNQYRLLTREEEIELGKRITEQDDSDAAFIMATSNLRLVVKIALEFQRVWMQNLLDLIQEGNIGLMHAVQKFDPYKNVKFSYYASFWIKAYLKVHNGQLAIGQNWNDPGAA